MRIFLAAAALAAFTLPALPASANEIAQCLANTDGSGEACKGIVALPCLDTEAGMSTHGQVDCIAGETVLWDEVLNADYKRLMALLDQEQKDALRTAQRAWIALRDADCGFPHILVRGTMARPWGADCMREMTADRVLWLRGFLSYLAN